MEAVEAILSVAPPTEEKPKTPGPLGRGITKLKEQGKKAGQAIKNLTAKLKRGEKPTVAEVTAAETSADAVLTPDAERLKRIEDAVASTKAQGFQPLPEQLEEIAKLKAEAPAVEAVEAILSVAPPTEEKPSFWKRLKEKDASLRAENKEKWKKRWEGIQARFKKGETPTAEEVAGEVAAAESEVAISEAASDLDEALGDSLAYAVRTSLNIRSVAELERQYSFTKNDTLLGIKSSISKRSRLLVAKVLSSANLLREAHAKLHPEEIANPQLRKKIGVVRYANLARIGLTDEKSIRAAHKLLIKTDADEFIDEKDVLADAIVRVKGL